MEVLSEHLCEGWLEGYHLDRTARPVRHLRGVRHGLRLDDGAAHQVAGGEHQPALARAVASLNILLTSTCWRNDHNGFSHQGPGLIDVMLSKRGTVARIYLPPDANCLLSVADHCLRSRNYVNLIVIDKQPQLQWLDMDAAIEHCARGASIWQWASNDQGEEPDVVLACAGDIPTLETVAAAWWLRQHVPDLKVRVVNVVDLMTLFPPHLHPHGMRRNPVRRAVHRRQAGHLRLPRLSARDPRDRPWARQRGALPCARLQRAGHDHHALRHGRAERHEPLPPGNRGDAPRPAHLREQAQRLDLLNATT